MASSTIPPPRLARADPLVGSVINGKYRVVSLVASGGMGKIYRGEQLVLGRDVALKVLHPHSAALLEDASFKKRFFLEASILSRLQHPNIVTLFDYGAIEGGGDRYFMAMEFLAGETLMRRIYERVSLTPKETVRIGKEIAFGLGEAHAHGLVHRDLKPSNVMLVRGRDGRELVKVLDFGIVKVLDPNENDEAAEIERNDLTQEGSFIGSPKYMAPEQITRGTKVDARTDVYSLGIILYQCLCGAVPFEARSSIETMMAHLNDEAIPLRERPAADEIPEWLEQLVMACIAKDPDRRPATMELVARVLEGAEPTLSSGGASGRFPAHSPGSSPDLQGDDPQQTNRYPTTMRPTRSSARMLAHSAHPSSSPSSSPSGSGPSARPSGSHSSGTHAITEAGTAIGSLPPRDHVDTEGHARRLRMAPVMIVGAVLLGTVALLGERVIRKSATESAMLRRDGEGESTPKATFRLIVESTPPGADVVDGNEVLGATPLSLAIDNALVRASPRKLVLKRAGYEPYAILQGPSEDNVRLLASLVAASPTPVSPLVSPPLSPNAPHIEPHIADPSRTNADPSQYPPPDLATHPATPTAPTQAVNSKPDSNAAPKPESLDPDPKADSKRGVKPEGKGDSHSSKADAGPGTSIKAPLDIRLTR